MSYLQFAHKPFLITSNLSLQFWNFTRLFSFYWHIGYSFFLFVFLHALTLLWTDDYCLIYIQSNCICYCELWLQLKDKIEKYFCCPLSRQIVVLTNCKVNLLYCPRNFIDNLHSFFSALDLNFWPLLNSYQVKS